MRGAPPRRAVRVSVVPGPWPLHPIWSVPCRAIPLPELTPDAPAVRHRHRAARGSRRRRAGLRPGRHPHPLVGAGTRRPGCSSCCCSGRSWPSGSVTPARCCTSRRARWCSSRCSATWTCPGFPLLALGAALNMLVIVANGGFMPSAPQRLGAAQRRGRVCPTTDFTQLHPHRPRHDPAVPGRRVRAAPTDPARQRVLGG